MKVYLNGEEIQFNGAFLSDLIHQNGLSEKKGIAVAVNETIISKSNWVKTEIKQEDKVLVITATQGG